jgi:hypothetical protein
MKNINSEKKEFDFKFTKLPNCIVENMNCFSPSDIMILIVIARKTYGFHKDYDQISLSQFEFITGLSRPTVICAKKKLLQSGVIFQKSDRYGNLYYAFPENLEDICNHLASKKSLPNKLNNLTSSSKKSLSELVKNFNSTSKESLHTKEITKETIKDIYKESDFNLMESLDSFKIKFIEFYPSEKYTSKDLNFLLTGNKFYKLLESESIGHTIEHCLELVRKYIQLRDTIDTDTIDSEFAKNGLLNLKNNFRDGFSFYKILNYRVLLEKITDSNIKTKKEKKWTQTN